jgi:predicted transcriptional regulator of viral defense system
MTQNTTILSKKESLLLESLMAKYSLLVNFDQIQAELDKNYSRQQVRNLVAKMSKNGWLVRIKKGVYHIANLESRGFAGASTFIIAQNILEESYISLESALQFHGIFDQYLKMVTSFCLKKQASKEIQDITYKFVKTSKKNFYGWQDVQIEGRMVKIATLEKAILDMIHFQRTLNSLDLVLEKLREYGNNFDLQKLYEFSKNQSITVQKIMGFLLDKANLDSNQIRQSVKGAKGASLMTKDSNLFNAKWNLYYHNHFK